MLNLSTIKTPGVYIDEVSVLPPSVAGVETGIPAFIGYTAKAETLDGKPITGPKRILSLMEYRQYFGKAHPEDDLMLTITDVKDGEILVKRNIEAKFKDVGRQSPHNLYYALQLFYANGGGPCYIIPVGQYKESINLDDLKDGLDKLEEEDEPTMVVIPEAINLDESGYFTLYNEALKRCADLGDRVAIIDVKQPESGDISDHINAFRKDSGGLEIDNLRFGAAYYPYLNTTVDYEYTGKESSITITHKVMTLNATGESKGEFDGKSLFSLKTSNNLLYERCKQQLAEVPLVLPPSAAVAGVYARVDSERGVWKAPANVGISAIIGPSIKVTDASQDIMNIDPATGKSVNAIRAIAGRGTVVWGARTLDGNSNEWRYVNVRRFFNFVEESIKKATYRFVFEPNDANTWVSVRAMIENFLILQWRAGALQGAKPEQAFKVSVGLGQTMTPDDVLNGRLIVQIELAVVRPAEFIILRFMHKLPE